MSGCGSMLLASAGSSGAVVSPLAGGAAYNAAGAASLVFATDGNVTLTGAASQSWFAPTQAGIGSSYWVRCTRVSGVTPTGSALGTWLQLSANRTWSVSWLFNVLKTCTLTLESASDSAGATIVASGTYTITADGI